MSAYGSGLYGAGEYPGAHLFRAWFSTDGSLWVEKTTDVRSFSISRGRENELTDVDAGTATLTLDNRVRWYDPVHNTVIRPMNRWKLEMLLADTTVEPMFVGYAEAYDQQWRIPNDAYTVVICSDEFSKLARAGLRTSNPPRDSYPDVVAFDNPNAGYWPMNVVTGARIIEATAGQPLTASNAIGGQASLIIGDNPVQAGAVLMSNGQQLFSPFSETGSSGDVTSLPEFTLELWFKFAQLPAADRTIVSGPGANGATTYVLKLLTTGALSIEARNSAGTNHTVTSSALATGPTGSDPFYHVVGTITGGSLRLYIDSVEVGSTAWTGAFHGTLITNTQLAIGTSSGTDSHSYDELAIYRQGLAADRVLAHFEAGRVLGYNRTVGSSSSLRATALLDEVDSQAPRQIGTATRSLTGMFMRGQDALGELKQAARCEGPDGLLFIARDGAVVLLTANHRSSSPYNTVQATFDDDGTDLPYHDLDLDYSDAFLVNDWQVSRVNGRLISRTDATSIATYGKRSQAISDLPIYSGVDDDSDVEDIADALLAKYKDPLTRILSITFKTSDPDLTEAIFRRDIADKVRIFRTPPGGGTRIDQSVWIQKVSVTGVPGVSGSLQATVTWAVSPL